MRRNRIVFSAEAEREVAEEELVIKGTRGLWASAQYPSPNMPDNALLDSTDVYPGTMKVINGRENYLASVIGAYQITGIHAYQRHTASAELLYTANGTLYKGANKTSIESGLTDNNVEFVTFKDVVYYVNGDNGLRSYNGTSAGAVTPHTPGTGEPANYLSDASNEIHNSRYIETHDNAVYLASPSNIPYRLYRSDELTGPTYFHHYVDVESKRGGKIVGLKAFNGVLIVLKDDSIHAVDGLTGDKTFRKRVLHADIGCLNGRTAQEVPGFGLVFLGSDRHFYVLRPEYTEGENIPLYRLSSHISDVVEQIDPAHAIGAKPKMAAGVKGSLYWCTIALPSNYIFELLCDTSRAEDIDIDPTSIFVPWSPMTNGGHHAYATFFDGTTKYFLGGDRGGMIEKIDYVSAHTVDTDLTPQVLTKPLDMGHPNRLKVVSEVKVTARMESSADNMFYASVNADDGGATAVATTSKLCGTYSATPTDGTTSIGTSVRRYRTFTIPVNRAGVAFRVKLHEASGEIPFFEVTEIRVKYSFVEER